MGSLLLFCGAERVDVSPLAIITGWVRFGVFLSKDDHIWSGMLSVPFAGAASKKGSQARAV